MSELSDFGRMMLNLHESCSIYFKDPNRHSVLTGSLAANLGRVTDPNVTKYSVKVLPFTVRSKWDKNTQKATMIRFSQFAICGEISLIMTSVHMGLENFSSATGFKCLIRSEPLSGCSLVLVSFC
ncbi:hypothetical protein BVRB_9g225980 [Beta vulgaris subsp. vulgaris]|uniref:Uncharacterized protein n=1 Tax=Beta vulgaris subsp. vulgaris TaxID=3555 RepID=A0A0J8B926_BETVV|nr:hypothetical protein BVRB_9g225980 [Beta vulgaris subsp. vulgaris]